MLELPELERLSPSEKDDLIRALFAHVHSLAQQVAALSAKVAELEGRLAKNSQNSSKPPSSDGLSRPQPKSLRKATGKPNGGQKGHSGQTLKQVAEPDHIEIHEAPDTCDACGAVLAKGELAEKRQVFDLPKLKHVVTEHRVLQVCCPCGKRHRGVFPVAVSAPVQYGPGVKAAVVHLTHHHMQPLARTGSLMGDLFGLPISEASVLAIHTEARKRLAPTVQAIGEAIQDSPVAHADETGMRVRRSLQWLHVLATPFLTWMGCHQHRGKKAFDAFGIHGEFTGTLVHDGWRPYRDLACLHALCNAHHLRELTYVFEEMKQAWAGELIEHLLAAYQEVNEAGSPLTSERTAFYQTGYHAILEDGEAHNPRAPRSGKRGGTKQSKALNLIDRLRIYADDVWRFATDPGVPFSNNVAEQAVRMPKVKQKISGGFRTIPGLETFCTIRSYLATLHKQGANLYSALTQVFDGNVPQPRFA